MQIPEILTNVSDFIKDNAQEVIDLKNAFDPKDEPTPIAQEPKTSTIGETAQQITANVPTWALVLVGIGAIGVATLALKEIAD